jgi:hypothetical protein
LASTPSSSGVLTAKEMMALYFTQDGNSTQKWRLKGHADERVLALGRVVGDRDAPAIRRRLSGGRRALRSSAAERASGGGGGREPARHRGRCSRWRRGRSQERREARKSTLAERVAAAVAKVEAEPDEQWLVWCDLNDESDALAKRITGAVEVKGADTVEHKEAALLGFADGRSGRWSPSRRSRATA